MRFGIGKTELQSALSAVGKAVAARPQLPILSAVKLEAEHNIALLRRRDKHCRVRRNKRYGAVCIDYKMLSGIIASMAPGRISIRA